MFTPTPEIAESPLFSNFHPSLSEAKFVPLCTAACEKPHKFVKAVNLSFLATEDENEFYHHLQMLFMFEGTTVQAWLTECAKGCSFSSAVGLGGLPMLRGALWCSMEQKQWALG